MIYSLLKFVLKPFFFLLWIKEVRGLENVPTEGPIIIASNHSSYMDFLCLSAVLKRRIYFLAAEKFYTSKLWRPLVSLTGQIKVDRTSKDKSAVYEGARAILQDGNILGIFPEGKRSRDGLFHKGFAGVAKIAQANEVNILPVGIKNAFEVWPPHAKWPQLKRIIEIDFGKLVMVNLNEKPQDIVDRLVFPEISKLSGLKINE